MAKALKFLIGIIAVAALAFAGLSAFGASQSGSSDPISTIKNSAMDTVIDQSGIKSKVESALRSNASSIASATGMSESQVETAIDDLDIDNWKCTNLPSDAEVTNTYNGNYGGTEATITTYADPSYVTVTAEDQNVTLSVPASAQQYVQYLQYL